ncbi:MAG: AGE family epimerase/isomerase [Anaerolineae bacterium]|nr:AGE family epimerase/isomerase [Anaerolineae bacterium]
MMIDKHTLQTYLAKAETELRENILPFWMKYTLDRELGGFYGEISNDLVINKAATKGALLTARILWTYAAAYRRYRIPEYLEMAHYAYDALIKFFWDVEYGGLYWEIAAGGTLLKPRKQIYGQAFGIYALAEYYAATGMAAALEKAIAIFRAMETYSYDPVHQGYFEAYTRAWEPVKDLRLSDKDMNEVKSQNTLLHIMEAYTNLLRVWDDNELRHQLAELLNVMMTRVISPTTYHTILFFDADWTPKSDHISYGHDIEASWLLVEAAEVVGDADLLARARALALKMAQAVYDEGVDPDGAVLYEADPHGFTHTGKEWWPQAEAAVGFLNAYQLSVHQETDGGHFLAAALRSWDFIETYLVDREHGEWFRYVTRDHVLESADAAKVSFWKCPYHNGRACMELTARLKSLL